MININQFQNKSGSREVICILGLPASGKGTQAKLMAEKLSAKIISIGDLIREELENPEITGLDIAEVKDKYDRGIPQDDDTIFKIIRGKVDFSATTLIFDNFPFSRNQCEKFFDFCDELKIKKPSLFYIKVSPDTALERVATRRICERCESIFLDESIEKCDKCGGKVVVRADDKREIVENRIKIYQERIAEILTFFHQRSKVFEIDGEKSIPEVWSQIEADLKILN